MIGKKQISKKHFLKKRSHTFKFISFSIKPPYFISGKETKTYTEKYTEL